MFAPDELLAALADVAVSPSGTLWAADGEEQICLRHQRSNPAAAQGFGTCTNDAGPSATVSLPPALLALTSHAR